MFLFLMNMVRSRKTSILSDVIVSTWLGIIEKYLQQVPISPSQIVTLSPNHWRN